MNKIRFEKVVSLTCFFFFILFTNVIHGQTAQSGNSNGLLPNVIPSSPEAASLGKFGEWPVSEYTGTPSINIPIYTIKVHGLEIPVQLSYHASGIKVDEMASWVGTGWTLSAGGAINRTIVGLADDDPGGMIQQNMTGNPLQASYSVGGENDYRFFRKIADLLLDGEPDLYYYNFLGNAGKFCFDVAGDFHTIPVSNLKVVQSAFAGLAGTTVANNEIWIMADDKGNTFYFGSGDYVTGGNNGVEWTNSGPQPLRIENRKITSWYLTKVITADKADTVYFDYGLKSEMYYVSPNVSLQTLTNFAQLPEIIGADWQSLLHSNQVLYNGALAPGATKLQSQSLGATCLKKIRWRDGEIDFVTSTQRQDMPLSTFASYMLDGVNIYNQAGTQLNSFQLFYSLIQNRYYLDSLRKTGQDKTPPLTHSFGYIDRNDLPATPSLTGVNSFAQDHWGYFNGATGNTVPLPPSINMPTSALTYITANREPDTVKMQYGTLNKITYPTGGSTQFDYQSNRYDPTSPVGGSNPTSVIQGRSGSVTTNASLPYYNMISINPDFTQSGVTITAHVHNYNYDHLGINMTLLPYVMFGYLNSSNVFQQLYYGDAHGNLPASITTDGAYDFDFTVPAQNMNAGSTYYLIVGDSCLKTINCAGLSPSQIPSMSATINYHGYAPPSTTDGPPPLPVAGGLRVYQISNYGNDGNLITRKRYTYNAGELLRYPKYYKHFHQDVTKMANGVLDTYKEPGWTIATYCGPIWADLYEETSTSQVLLGVTQSSPVGYTQVTETEVDNAGNDNGYTVSDFSYTPDATNQMFYDYTTWQDPYDVTWLSQMAPLDNLDYKRGLLTSKNIFKRMPDNTYVKIQSLANTYNFNDNDATKNYCSVPAFHEIRLQYTDMSDGLDTYVCSPDGIFPMNYGDGYGYAGDFAFSLSHTISGWVQNTSSVQTLYDQNGLNPVTTSTITYYDNPLHLQPTRIVTNRSNHNSLISLMNYPQDYAAGTAFIDAMIAHHDIVTPIETVKYEVTPSGTTSILGGKITTYLPDGKGLIDRIKLLETSSPVPLSSFTFSNTSIGQLPYTATTKSVFAPDSRYVDRAVSALYDSYANPLQQYKVDDINSSYVWDYKHLYPVAKVINASVGDIAFTSFEADGTGGWTVAGTTLDNSHSITGRNSYSLSSGSISKSGLNSSTTYIVSYWTNHPSAYTITGTVSGYPKIGKSTGGWTYFEHQVTGQSTITIGGTGLIDELRLYPVGSQMTSYTYTPLVGLTTVDDVGSRIIYYEYDGMERLKRIRDQDRNILKAFEYQYQAQAGCGSNCSILTMQNNAGATTFGYPVGVFSLGGKLLGNATNQARFVSLWNGDSGDAAVGTLAAGADSMHFQFTLNSGHTLPTAITGCRYYQVDLAYNKIDGIRNINGTYVDFGDGTGMHLGATDTSYQGLVLAPNTTVTFFGGDPTPYFIHTYGNDSSQKTLTFYHNDDRYGTPNFDNAVYPATSLTLLKNLRGNISLGLTLFGGSCYQQASMSSVANVTNWNSITGIDTFRLVDGDLGVGVLRNIAYTQDFMKNNRNLFDIETSFGPYNAAYRDTSFKLSTLKSDWNTYFLNLQKVSINDDHWNREDLSALKKLVYFVVTSTTESHDDTPGSPLVPIPTANVDAILQQIMAGSGQTVSNGILSIGQGGTTRSSASDVAVAFLKAKGWTIYVNAVLQ